jgi:hypothetical protein
MIIDVTTSHTTLKEALRSILRFQLGGIVIATGAIPEDIFLTISMDSKTRLLPIKKSNRSLNFPTKTKSCLTV